MRKYECYLQVCLIFILQWPKHEIPTVYSSGGAHSKHKYNSQFAHAPSTNRCAGRQYQKVYCFVPPIVCAAIHLAYFIREFPNIINNNKMLTRRAACLLLPFDATVLCRYCRMANVARITQMKMIAFWHTYCSCVVRRYGERTIRWPENIFAFRI